MSETEPGAVAESALASPTPRHRRRVKRRVTRPFHLGRKRQQFLAALAVAVAAALAVGWFASASLGGSPGDDQPPAQAN